MHWQLEKKLVKQQYLLHMFPQLRPTNGWDLLASLGHPSKFNRFRILASLLHRCHSTVVNQTLQDVWSSPGLVHYIYIFGGSCPLTNICQLQNSLYVQVLRSPVLPALLHGNRAAVVSQILWRVQWMELQNFCRGRHLYSAGRPSRWASAHILVS